jgi:hypothetical protein
VCVGVICGWCDNVGGKLSGDKYFVLACVCVCLPVCLSVCVYAYVCVCLCVYVSVCLPASEPVW